MTRQGRRGLLVILVISIAVCLVQLCQDVDATVYTLTRTYYDAEGNEVDITQEVPVEEQEQEQEQQEEDEPLELLVNINTADIDALDQLPGIGPALAQRIIDYREAYGGFIAPEELMEVKGVGEKLYAKIAPYIIVNALENR